MACCLLLPLRTAAQDFEEEELDEEFELMEESAEIVISAAKHEQKIGFSPAAVVLITRKEIEASGATTLIELLRYFPVTDVYEIVPLYQTIETRSTYRSILLIDGREVNHELFFTPFYDILPVELEEVERIEIVLGPNSAIYGANAVSAVINIITKKPTDKESAGATLQAGEKGWLEFDGYAQGGGEAFGLRLSGGLSRAGDWLEPGKKAKEVERANARARLELGRVDLNLDCGFVHSRGRIFGVLGNLEVNGIWMVHADLSLRYEKLRLRSYWYGMRGPLELELGLIYPPLGIELGRVPTVDITGDTLHNEAQLDVEPFAGNLLILGADVRYTRYHSATLVQDTIEELRAGIYFHDEQKIANDWLLQAGLRFDWNSRTDWALSPRGAIVYNFAPGQYLRLSGGMAFRKPSLLETSANFEVEVDPAFPEVEELFEEKGLSNPDLGNELLGALEAGYRGEWLEGRLRLSLDAYATFNRHVIGFRTEIVFDETPLGPRLNLDGSKIGYEDLDDDSDVYGAHLALEAYPLEWLTLFLRAELRQRFFSERGYRNDLYYPRYLAALGGSIRSEWGLRGQAALMAIGSGYGHMRDPESILAPSLNVRMPARNFVLAYLGYGFELAPLRGEVGVSFFDAFNVRFREFYGAISKSGVNYGGEVLGRRLMALLRIDY